MPYLQLDVPNHYPAEVKRGLKLTRGRAPNAGQGEGAPPCPPRYKKAIRRVLTGPSRS